MIKKPLKFLVLVALFGACLTVPAIAQERIAIKLTSVLTTKWNLLKGKNVLEDLKLGAEKSKTIVKLLDDAMIELRAFSPSGVTSMEEVQEAINDHVKVVEKKFIPKLTGAMTAEQLIRLGEIELQIGAIEVLESKSVAQKLELTSEQNAKVKDLVKKASDEISEMTMKNSEDVASPENGTIMRKPSPKAAIERQKISTEYRAKFMKLLTPEQVKTWGTMVGEPLKAIGAGK